LGEPEFSSNAPEPTSVICRDVHGRRRWPAREAFVHGRRTPVRGDRANTALSLECAVVRRHQLARVRRTALVAGRYPTYETCSAGRREGPRTLAATSVHRDATDGAHSRVHDAIQRLIRKATSGIPGRNSRALSLSSRQPPKCVAPFAEEIRRSGNRAIVGANSQD